MPCIGGLDLASAHLPARAVVMTVTGLFQFPPAVADAGRLIHLEDEIIHSSPNSRPTGHTATTSGPPPGPLTKWVESGQITLAVASTTQKTRCWRVQVSRITSG